MRGDGPLRIRKLKTRERLASHARGYILFEKTMYKKAEVIKKKHMLCSAFSTPLEVSKISRLRRLNRIYSTCKMNYTGGDHLWS